MECSHDNERLSWGGESQAILKWFNKVIPKLFLKSVLIMDNAAYHNVQVDRPPVMAYKKIVMQKWLKTQGSL